MSEIGVWQNVLFYALSTAAQSLAALLAILVAAALFKLQDSDQVRQRALNAFQQELGRRNTGLSYEQAKPFWEMACRGEKKLLEAAIAKYDWPNKQHALEWGLALAVIWPGHRRLSNELVRIVGGVLAVIASYLLGFAAVPYVTVGVAQILLGYAVLSATLAMLAMFWMVQGLFTLKRQTPDGSIEADVEGA